MNATLHALAEIYRSSSAGRAGAVKDYTIDWEKFLRLTGRDDGDARELAEEELLAAERLSGGHLVIDRHRRSGARERLRLILNGGEEWLFSVTGQASPNGQREVLSQFFREAISKAPDTVGWDTWLEGLAVRALDGGSVQPFKRDDEPGNSFLLEVLLGVLSWKTESLVRYASMVLCRDSKELERLRPRLVTALREITGRGDASLEDYGISDVPRSVWLHGPLALGLPGGVLDLGLLSGPVAISATDLDVASMVRCDAAICLTVENESVFRELVKLRMGVLLVLTSFPGAATRLLFSKLHPDTRCYHFGDSDPAGFDILRDLRERTGREFLPLLMRFRPHGESVVLTESDRRDIVRLLACDTLADVHGELEAMLSAGVKGDFEQESCPLREVRETVEFLLQHQ